jgi:hypothetical protein
MSDAGDASAPPPTFGWEALEFVQRRSRIDVADGLVVGGFTRPASAPGDRGGAFRALTAGR